MMRIATLSLLVQFVASMPSKATAGMDAATIHEPTTTDDEGESPSGASNATALLEFATNNIQFHDAAAKDAFLAMSAPHANSILMASEGAKPVDPSAVGTNLMKAMSSCQQYGGQFFKGRVFLTGSSSFTGIGSTTLAGCASLTYLYSTLASSCHYSGWFYSNAAAQSSGYGQCRCLPSSATSFTRYYSSAGNNIYRTC